MSRNPIQENFVILCSQLNLDKILPYLKQERMVTTDEYEVLTNPNFTVKQRREKLLIWLPRKGRNYFTKFGKCLVWSGQSELARHIGVDISLVPEPPFKLPDEPSPEERHQQVMNMLRNMISSVPPATVTPTYLPTSAHQQAVPTTVTQPSSSGRGDPLPGSSHQTVQPSAVPPANVVEPMEIGGGPAIPVHQRGGGRVPRRSATSQEPTTVTQTKGKVFILYCKDPHLPQTFSDDVLDLADTLNHCGGFRCTVDHYVDVPPPNWNVWTQQRIEESQYVILVYSPTLAQVIQTSHDYTLNMEKGKYYANGIVNLIHPSKFIPVLLNGYKPVGDKLLWLPPQLRMCTNYEVSIAEFREAISVPEDTPRHVLDKKLAYALCSDDRFKEIARLIYHLRNESEITPPIPPQVPIHVPPPTAVHVGHVPGPLRLAQPQSDLEMVHALGVPGQYVGGVQPHDQLSSMHPTFQTNHQIVALSGRSLHLVRPEEQQVRFDSHDSVLSQAASVESHHLVQPVQQQEGIEADDISDITIGKIAIRVKHKWFDLGMKLKIESSELEAIQDRLSHITGYEEATVKMINLWKRTWKELATKKALKWALVSIEHGRLAEELFHDV